MRWGGFRTDGFWLSSRGKPTFPAPLRSQVELLVAGLELDQRRQASDPACLLWLSLLLRCLSLALLHPDMSRAERLLELLQLLRNRSVPISGERLASELGISIRTLYRDIASLQAQGADIRGEPGMGYVLKPGFTLPPLMFSTDEIEALVLGARWVERRAQDNRLSAAARSLLSKVTAVLPASLRDSVAATNLLVAGDDVVPASVDLSLIRAAVRSQNKLELLYKTGAVAPNTPPELRVVWPFAIAFFERVRVVLAWCELRQDFRAFRLDRITSARLLEDYYTQKRHVLLKLWRQKEGVRPSDPAGN